MEKSPLPHDRLPETPEPAPGRRISRRSFMKMVGAIAAGSGLGTLLAHEPVPDQPEKRGAQPAPPPDSPAELISDIGEALKETSADSPEAYWDTALKQGLMLCGKEIASAVFDELGIEQGNQERTQERVAAALRERPLATILRSVAVAPLVEETVYRLLPSRYLRQETTPRWGAGIGIATLFALSHNIRQVTVDGRTDIEFVESVPVIQFMGGLFYWYLMEEKGFRHALLAHGMNNTYQVVAAGLAELFKKPAPEERPPHNWGGTAHKIASIPTIRTPWNRQRDTDAAEIDSIRARLRDLDDTREQEGD